MTDQEKDKGLDVPEVREPYKPPHHKPSMKKVAGVWIDTDDKNAVVTKEQKDDHTQMLRDQGLDPNKYPAAQETKKAAKAKAD